jgi:VTC domain
MGTSLTVAAAATSGDDSFQQVLARFDDASPDLIAARALQRRVDRKYMFPKRLLATALESLPADYRVARAADALVARYETVYFDTPDRQLFDDHRRGRRPRYKVRLRHYCDRQLSFIEVKQKGGCTSKMRLELPFTGGLGESDAPAAIWKNPLSADAARFVDQQCPIPAERLRPVIWVTFSRLTLVGDRINERVTFDWNVAYGDGDTFERLPEIVVAEVKQAGPADDGAAIQTLSRLDVREQTLSKYCLATMRLTSMRAHTLRPCLQVAQRLAM